MTWRWEKVNECMERRYISGEGATVAQFRLKAGCVAQRHSHPNEQISVVLEGVIEFDIGGMRFTASTGDVVYVPPGVEHEAVAITDAVVIDVFSPPRKDWVTK
ncbi:Cupin 2, conserved barrel domain protein [Pyrobaculum islandicum DSM 4184]|uniref:Cupin 2, conserved barrel domain protein n=1 Tax=Pyrobaculum islandicum (strain DSM 4184 / JCM 9189 / GEO3) TaxID=384616 RepID=A1RUC4_PYRIL|nr:cupin domain-containing protein [Pyrobaculum islandicum]ABL88556.1 Cupin 2, conserved barrel domain protein [Pyrobaculum islandicum DSM 4184]